jgi:hypothetical protein
MMGGGLVRRVVSPCDVELYAIDARGYQQGDADRRRKRRPTCRRALGRGVVIGGAPRCGDVELFRRGVVGCWGFKGDQEACEVPVGGAAGGELLLGVAGVAGIVSVGSYEIELEGVHEPVSHLGGGGGGGTLRSRRDRLSWLCSNGRQVRAYAEPLPVQRCHVEQGVDCDQDALTYEEICEGLTPQCHRLGGGHRGPELAERPQRVAEPKVFAELDHGATRGRRQPHLQRAEVQRRRQRVLERAVASEVHGGGQHVKERRWRALSTPTLNRSEQPARGVGAPHARADMTPGDLPHHRYHGLLGRRLRQQAEGGPDERTEVVMGRGSVEARREQSNQLRPRPDERGRCVA